MSATADPVGHFLGDFDAVRTRLPGHDLAWLRRARAGALERFAHLGFPGPREEAWKYTRTTPIERGGFRCAADAGPAPSPADLASWCLGNGTRLVFVDGRYREALSNPGTLPPGARVQPLARALEEVPELVEAHLGASGDEDTPCFEALNGAFMTDGALIHLASGVELDSPLELLFVTTGEQSGIATHPRILLVAEEGARATVLETWAGLGETPVLNNAFTEMVLGAGARIDHVKLQHESPVALHLAGLRVRQGADSRYARHGFAFGARLAREEVRLHLDGPGADCLVNALCLAGGRQHADLQAAVEHAVPRCTSDTHFRAIADGRSRAVFVGRVHVHPGAQRTDAHQASDSLLLSREAEVDTKPELEIYADDVKCAHGATVGQLDESAIFYLQTRGIDREAARALLTYGFARTAVDRVETPALREHCARALLGRLPAEVQLEEMPS